jgi:nitrate/TMAO reductase-like tetraheme cytochrome c subunit
MSRKFVVILIIVLGVAAVSVYSLLNLNSNHGFSNRWEEAVTFQEIPSGLTSLSAKECGSCHVEHYEEWKSSTHAQAWNDMQFQAEIAKETSPYMCINCHTPLQNQQPFIVTGLVDGDVYQPIKHENPKFDKELQQEGINCASCHVRDGVIISTSVSNNAPHKSVQNAPHLSEQLCLGCHNATAVITPELVCTFETGDEWRAGPFYGTKNCISCHMPALNRPIAKDSETRPSKMHYFMGSGIPKHDTLKVERLDGLVFSFDDFSTDYVAVDSIELKVTVTNKIAGHRVPTGDPERFIITTFAIYDLEEGNLISQDTFRIGEEWIWYPEAKKVSDNNMMPGESRDFELTTALNEGQYEFVLKSFKFRTTKKLREYNKIPETYPISIKFYEKRIAFDVK